MQVTTQVCVLLTVLVVPGSAAAGAAPENKASAATGDQGTPRGDAPEGDAPDAPEAGAVSSDAEPGTMAGTDPEAGSHEGSADPGEVGEADEAENDAPPVAAADPAKTEAEVTVAHPTERASSLLPAGEAERMAKQPLDSGAAHFKPGTGLVLKSQDGRFSVAPRLRVQFLYLLDNDNGADELGHSLSIRRARLQFAGNVFGEHNKYKVEFAFSPRDLGMKDGSPTQTPILSWYAEFDYLRDLTFKVGQYKVPYSRQRVISSGDLEMVDRSLGNGEFNLDRDIGIEVMSKDIGGLDHLRYHAGIFMGEGRDRFETQNDFGMHYLGRFEVLPLGGASGKWDYSEADFDRLRKPRLSLGVAYAYIDNAKRDRGILGSAPTDGGTTDYHNVTADFFFKVAGLSLSGEFYWREGKRAFGDATEIDDMGNEVPAPRVPTRDGIGYFVQAGYLIPRQPIGLAARWSQVIGLGADNETSLNDGDEVGGAVSYYFAQHPLKLQLDYFRKRRDSYDKETLTASRQSWADSSDEVRLQMQFAF